LYFHNMRYKENMSSKTIFSFFFLKYPCIKLNFKIVQLRHIRIKMVIIIVLKSNMRVDLRQWPSHESGWSGQHTNNSYYHSFKTQLESQPVIRFRSHIGRVNVRIKVTIIIVLKVNSEIDLGKTRVNVRINMVIIVILKLNSRVSLRIDLGQNSIYVLRGPTWG